MSKKGRRRGPQNAPLRSDAAVRTEAPGVGSLSPACGPPEGSALTGRGRLRCSSLLLVACLLLAFPALETGRFAYFAATESGMEHDSGWYFGVSRNLAERGMYAASTNMAKTDEPISEGIHDRPCVQDAEGYSYFCSGVTVGPGFIVPEAAVLKLFGIGWWQYRLLPLSVMFALLVVISALAYRGGGLGAVLLVQLWLWALPTVTLRFAFEAFSEHLALFYSLLAMGVYAYGLQVPQPKRWPWFLSGLLLALAFLTKSVYLLTAVAVGLHWLGTVYQRRPDRRQLRSVLLFTALGFLLPVALFEGYRFVVLVHQFGMAGYSANNLASAIVFRSAGSGLETTAQDRWALMITKLSMLETLGFSQPIFAWGLVLLAAGLALRPRRDDAPHARSDWPQTVLAVVGLKILLTFCWFIGFSSSTFTRHAWDGLVLLLLLTAIGVARAGQLLLRQRWATSPLGIVTLLLAVTNLVCFDFSSADLSPRIRYEQTLRWLTPYNRPLQSLMFAPVFRRDLQEQAVAFLQRTVGPEDRVYYIHRHKVAELPPLLGKVFFPIERYALDRPKLRGRAFVILGPFQTGDWPWRIEPEETIAPILRSNAKQIVFQNELYVVLQEPFQAMTRLLP